MVEVAQDHREEREEPLLSVATKVEGRDLMGDAEVFTKKNHFDDLHTVPGPERQGPVDQDHQRTMKEK